MINCHVWAADRSARRLNRDAKRRRLTRQAKNRIIAGINDRLACRLADTAANTRPTY